MSALAAFIALVAALAPAASRREFRAEWEAELSAEWSRQRRWAPVAGRALGAVPDAWFLRRQSWSLATIAQDVRFAVRLLVRDRALTIAAVVTLMLAIGANAALFSVLDAVMLRPIAATDPDRLVVAWQTAQNGTRQQAAFSYPDYRDWRAAAHMVERTALITASTAIVTGSGDAERLQGAAVTAGFFELLGTSIDGRAFTSADESSGAERVAIVSEVFRRRHLAAVAQPLGTLVAIDGVPRRVVGILRSDPLDGVFGAAADVWLPIQQRPQLEGRGNRNFIALARLAPGARTEDAQRELAAVLKRLEKEYPETNTGRGARVLTLQDQMSGESRQGLILAAAGAALLLLVACANVASMLVARGLTRGQEFATRTALGAGRMRLVRQLVIEALALSALGAAAGLALFAAGTPLLVSLLPITTPRLSLVGWNPRLALFGAALGGLAAVIASIPSAWRVGRPGTSSRTTGAGGGARNVLVAGQIATAVMVLIVAGLLATSLARLQRVDAGFPAGRLLTMQVQVRGPGYDSADKIIAFVDRLLARVDALPSVQRAAVIDPAPFTGNINRWDTSSDAGVPVFKADRYIATPSVFGVLNVRAVSGRLFGPADAGAGVAVVDELFASQAFPGVDPIGRTFRLESNAPRTVVGVVPHIKHYALDEDPRPQVYLPFASDPSGWLNLLVASSGDPAAAVADVRQAVRAVDPDIPPYGIVTLETLMQRSFGDRWLASRLAIALGLITLVVSAAGLYGTMQFVVARRRREIGVRLALGARPGGVVRMILAGAVRIAAAGTLLGVPLAVVATRSVRALLFDTRPFDAGVYAAVVALLAVVTLLAALVPAWRASRVDPLAAIRME